MQLKLTDTERLILANQYQILAHLEQDDSYAVLAEQLRHGHAWLYNQALESTLSKPLSEDEENYVVEVLDIYDTLQYSYRDLKDKSGIDAKKIEFPGFDGNNEGRLLLFSIALRKDNRFVDVIPERGKNSHMSTSVRYQRLLDNHERMGKPHYPLSKDQILELIS